MKKVFAIAVMILALTSYISLQAQTQTTDAKTKITNCQSKQCKNFVDKNNDGKCDNCGTDKCTCDKKGNHDKKQNCEKHGKKAGSKTCTGVCDGSGHKKGNK